MMSGLCSLVVASRSEILLVRVSALVYSTVRVALLGALCAGGLGCDDKSPREKPGRWSRCSTVCPLW